MPAQQQAVNVIGHFKRTTRLDKNNQNIESYLRLDSYISPVGQPNKFDIKNQAIKSFVYFGLLIGTPLTLIWNALVIKTKSRRIIWTIFPTLILNLILVV